MTPQQQIAYLRHEYGGLTRKNNDHFILAVCALAERGLVLEPLAQAVADAYEHPDDEGPLWSAVNALYELGES